MKIIEKKKIGFIILGVCALVLSVIGVTYAFWELRLSQSDEDKIASSCFNVTFIEDGSAIQLEKAYPIDDTEGKTLTPYKFTITNTCNANASYQINLEALERYDTNITIEEDVRLNPTYIRAQLNEVSKETEEETEIEKEIVNLDSNIQVTPTINDDQAKSYDAYKLAIGYLGPNESKSFALRIWLDGDLTVEDNEDAMNKTFASKITVITSYLSEAQMKPQVDLELATEGNGLYKVGHCDVTETVDDIGFSHEEYRYAGANYDETSNPTEYVHNYVKFNEELWRIIGLVNVKTSSGNIEQRLKIIRNESIGSHAWDNHNFGINDWTQSTLMTYLNTDYYNQENVESADTLKATAKGMIDQKIIWNIGGGYTSDILTATIYNYERGPIGGFDAPNITEWSNGEVALMYPSDYGYAVGGANRNTCLTETTLWNYDGCYDNDWLYFGHDEWLLMPNSESGLMAFYVYSYPKGRVIASDDRVYSPFAIHSVVYLSSSVKITEGTGEYNSPYELAMKG